VKDAAGRGRRKRPSWRSSASAQRLRIQRRAHAQRIGSHGVDEEASSEFIAAVATIQARRGRWIARWRARAVERSRRASAGPLAPGGILHHPLDVPFIVPMATLFHYVLQLAVMVHLRAQRPTAKINFVVDLLRHREDFAGFEGFADPRSAKIAARPRPMTITTSVRRAAECGGDARAPRSRRESHPRSSARPRRP